MQQFQHTYLVSENQGTHTCPDDDCNELRELFQQYKQFMDN